MKVKCIVCGKIEDVPPSRAKKYKTCSWECMGKMNSAKYSKKIKVNCVVCGKEVEIKPSRKNRFKTCSKECLKVYRSKIMLGEGNHQFGLRGTLNSTFKKNRMVKIKNDYVFVFVGSHPFSDNGWIREHRLLAEKYLLTEKNSVCVNNVRYLTPELEVHHIDFCKTNNEISNLKVLTKSEHRRLHCSYKKLIRDKTNGRIITVVNKSCELLENPEEDNQQPN